MSKVSLSVSLTCFIFANNLNAASARDPYQNQLFPYGSPPAKIVDVADIILAKPDVRLAAITLQGIVNRGKEAKIYYIEEQNCKDMLWLKIISLKGRWKSNIEAYEWAYENLLDKMSKEVMACFHPDYIPHNIRDFLVANKVFTFWITSKEKQDGVKSDF